MNEPYPIVPYHKTDRAAVFAFLQEPGVLQPGERLAEQWSWKYDDNPLNPQPDPAIWLMRDGAKMIGMMCSIPLKISIRGKIYPISHGCDLVIAPPYRGRHFGGRLIKHYYTQANRLGFSWLNEASHHQVVTMHRST